MRVLENDAIDGDGHKFLDVMAKAGEAGFQLPHEAAESIGRHLEFIHAAGEGAAG